MVEINSLAHREAGFSARVLQCVGTGDVLNAHGGGSPVGAAVSLLVLESDPVRGLMQDDLRGNRAAAAEISHPTPFDNEILRAGVTYHSGVDASRATRTDEAVIPGKGHQALNCPRARDAYVTERRAGSTEVRVDVRGHGDVVVVDPVVVERERQ